MPIHMDWPQRAAAVWPVTFGVPFGDGWLPPATELTVVDRRTGDAVPCGVEVVARWDDESPRWAHVTFLATRDGAYNLAAGSPQAPEGPVVVDDRTPGRIAVEAGPSDGRVSYRFRVGDGCFTDVAFTSGTAATTAAVTDSGRGFYVRAGPDGDLATLRADAIEVEKRNACHSVVRVQGAYEDDAGQHRAAATIYYHFYGDLPWCRISHKLIVTEDYATVAYREAGLRLRLPFGPRCTFTVATDAASRPRRFPLRETQRAYAVQERFPHFADTASVCRVASPSAADLHGAVCDDWCDVSAGGRGLGVQVPAFAEQFPKAFVAGVEDGLAFLQVELWSELGGRPLDFTTRKVLEGYFGADWVAPDTPIGGGGRTLADMDNNPAGTAKTHDLWLYPHVGGAEALPGLGGGRDEIYARADPEWVARSGVLGPVAENTAAYADGEPAIEAAIDDYFRRKVYGSQRVFPPNGYLYYGMHPYVGLSWEQRRGPAGADRWYPPRSQTARGRDYNLRRSMWVLWARGGSREYYNYSRRHARLSGDLFFSNWEDADKKPKGWMVRGFRDMPIVWGSWQRGGRRVPHVDSDYSSIALAGAADVIHFVWDWLFAADCHSRDSALAWRAAMETAFGWHAGAVRRQVSRPDSLLRMLASIYELDHSQQVRDFGDEILALMASIPAPVMSGCPDELPGDAALVGIESQKAADIYLAVYHFYAATGSAPAREALLRYAGFGLRHRWPEWFEHRNNVGLLLAGVVAVREAGDPLWGSQLNMVLEHQRHVERYRSPAQVAGYDQSTLDDWGQAPMTTQAFHAIGLPALLRARREQPQLLEPLPAAVKPIPAERTYVAFEHERGTSTFFDVTANVAHPDDFAPQLVGAAVQPVVSIHSCRRILEPHGSNSPWFQKYDTHVFARVEVPATAADGQYRLHFGPAAAYRVLRTNADHVVQEAPGGLFVQRGETHHFAPGSGDVVLFAQRPVRVFGPDGTEVEAITSDPKKGEYTYPNPGGTGLWSLRAAPNDERADRGDLDTFVRLARAEDSAFALDRPGRWFAAADRPAHLPAPRRTSCDAPDDQGRAAHGGRLMFKRVMQLEQAHDFPFREGTVEFRVKPEWSSTGFSAAMTDHTLALFAAGPITLTYRRKRDSPRTGLHNYSELYFDIAPVTNGNRSAGRLRFPARVWFEADRWLHIAATWRVDGQDSLARIFVDGRERSYYSFRASVDPTGIGANVGYLPAPPDPVTVSFGSDHRSGQAACGEVYRSLRVSKVIRWFGDFTPPATPLSIDGDTYLLANLDDPDPIGAGVAATLDGVPISIGIVTP